MPSQLDDKILKNVCDFCGIDFTTLVGTQYEFEIKMYTNAAFKRLYDLGICSTSLYILEDVNAIWSDYFVSGVYDVDVVMYISVFVRTKFDPSANTTVSKFHESYLTEMEYKFALRPTEVVV